ncbi:hypothetical protein ACJX0J_024614, partial [Zea mays]
ISFGMTVEKGNRLEDEKPNQTLKNYLPDNNSNRNFKSKNNNQKNPRGILISPGPSEPQDSGISLETVLELEKIICAPSGVMHGKSSPVYYDEELGKALFNGLPKYETFPHDALEATAWTADGLIMVACHKKYKHIQ